MHLTNNAVQIHSEKYGQLESGNQVSYDQFQKYLNEKKIPLSFRQKTIPRMKEIMGLTFEAAKSQLNLHDRKYCFEIFGFDFLLDVNCTPWLIEANTNPCLEESSPLLAMLIPRMLGMCCWWW